MTGRTGRGEPGRRGPEDGLAHRARRRPQVGWAAIAFALLVAVAGVQAGGEPPVAAASAAPRGQASSVTYRAASTRSIRLTLPSGAVAGDVLVASIGFGDGGRTRPSIAAPSGWTLAGRVDHAKVSAATYTHVLAAGEATFTWTTGTLVGGVAFLAAYAGVDRVNPVVASSGLTTGSGSATTAPSLTTTTPGSLVVTSYVGFRAKAKRSTWSPPSGMTELGDASDGGGTHASSTASTIQAAAGATGTKRATASNTQDASVGTTTILRPAATPTTTTTTTAPTTTTTPPAPSGAVPVIIDTDLFSDADDVGALATAFGLQVTGEAKVIAIGINTRTSRPAVATNSWRCAAAVAAFYGSGSVPIGTAMPNNGTEVNTADFVGPCAKLAPSSTPVPTSAVTVFRRALAAQPDGSVVVVEAGYAGNLAALLRSPADAASPLTGQELVARKVRRLAFMGGGYPKRSGENNLQGDPAAAAAVASSWPGPIVWDGYEVGDQIHTGSTISRTHPTSSPVRVAYEAFVGPGNWIYSYDLVAAFNGIRATDPSLTTVGPGTNVVGTDGSNTFTAGSGQQRYLKLVDAAGLSASIDRLLTTLPGSTVPPPTSGTTAPKDDFSTNSLGSTWLAPTGSSTVAARNQQLEITHPAGAWTRGTLQSAARFDLTGRSVQVQLKRAANGGAGGSTYGETSVSLAVDGTRQVELFVAGGSLTAWVRDGSSSTNLTPAWPRYDPTAMRWLRFRESGGTLSFEYASGTTAPGTWTTLATTRPPFSLGAVSLVLTAGSNVAATDTAVFDDVSGT